MLVNHEKSGYDADNGSLVKTIPVLSTELDEWLPRIEWHLGQFCANGQWEPSDLISRIRNRQSQLWIAANEEIKAVMLTEVGTDRLKTVTITHLAGKDRHEWLHLLADIKSWAGEINAKRLKAITRPGWERILTDFKKTHVVLEARI